MPGQVMNARELARRSQAAVTAKDRSAWLGLFAPDAVVQDPVGPSPLDPLGALRIRRDLEAHRIGVRPLTTHNRRREPTARHAHRRGGRYHVTPRS